MQLLISLKCHVTNEECIDHIVRSLYKKVLNIKKYQIWLGDVSIKKTYSGVNVWHLNTVSNLPISIPTEHLPHATGMVRMYGIWPCGLRIQVVFTLTRWYPRHVIVRLWKTRRLNSVFIESRITLRCFESAVRWKSLTIPASFPASWKREGIWENSY